MADGSQAVHATMDCPFNSCRLCSTMRQVSPSLALKYQSRGQSQNASKPPGLPSSLHPSTDCPCRSKRLVNIRPNRHVPLQHLTRWFQNGPPHPRRDTALLNSCHTRHVVPLLPSQPLARAKFIPRAHQLRALHMQPQQHSSNTPTVESGNETQKVDF
eukprot:evm.model.scf_36.4 EVM.evm.TU.scf_36.4   scf_36:132413-132886(-)